MLAPDIFCLIRVSLDLGLIHVPRLFTLASFVTDALGVPHRYLNSLVFCKRVQFQYARGLHSSLTAATRRDRVRRSCAGVS